MNYFCDCPVILMLIQVFIIFSLLLQIENCHLLIQPYGETNMKKNLFQKNWHSVLKIIKSYKPFLY